MAFDPSRSAGVLYAAAEPTWMAGAYSPFLFRVIRADGEQRLTAISDQAAQGPDRKAQPASPTARSPRSPPPKRGKWRAVVPLRAPHPPAHRPPRWAVVNVAAGSGPAPFYVQGTRLPSRPLQRRPALDGDHHPRRGRAL